MKTLKLIIFLILTIVIIFICYKYINKPSAEQQTTNDISEVQIEINKLRKQVNDYKLKEQEEELVKIRLQQLQDPEIINDELKNVNKLIVYEGTIAYNDYLKEGNWLANKSLTIELKYTYGIGIDLNTVTVDRFVDVVPIVKIPKGEMKLEYIELDTENSSIDGERSFFSTQFTPEIVESVLENAQENTKAKINNDKQIFDEALEVLKENIKALVVNKLGYEDVIFEEV